MKEIRRVANLYAQDSIISAGAYNGSVIANITSNFTLKVIEVNYSAFFYDSVTSQSLAGNALMDVTLRPQHSNPGLVSGYSTVAQRFSCASQGSSRNPVYMEFTGVQTMDITHYMYLSAVTANNVIGICCVQFVYLCPEDYLSVEPFD